MVTGLVEFAVVATTASPNEIVFVTGNCPELGNWNPDESVPMVRDTTNDVVNGNGATNGHSSGGTSSLWTVALTVPGNQEIRYRYLIGTFGELPGKRVIQVRVYETHIEPRVVTPKETDGMPQDAMQDSHALFGFIDGKERVQRGWLNHECEVHLRFLPSAIHWWKARHRTKVHSLKIVPMDLRHREHALEEDEDDDLSSPYTNDLEMAVLTKDECIFKQQSRTGKMFRPDEIVIFKMRVLEPNFMAYRCDFFAHEPGTVDMENGPEPRHVGCCYILPGCAKENYGERTVLINGMKHQPIGQLFVHYMLIQPTKCISCSTEVSYAKYWRRRTHGFDIGHRGSGNSFSVKTQRASVRENTIASLVAAATNGADFVEFDVQLSKDKIPVIYHDFSVFITMRRRRGSNDSTSSVSSVGSANGDDGLNELYEMPVKDLTIKQLHMLKLNHVTEKDGISRYEGANDHEPFPSLEKALLVLDEHVGFNVEIKFPLMFLDGRNEAEHFFERNEFLDLILNVVYQCAGKRRIIFSCFEPDVCAMLRVKQNKYPVLFLSHGESTLWPTPFDPRTQTTRRAVHTAVVYDLLGINMHTHNILHNEWLMQEAKDAGLVVLVWGDENNDPAVIRQLKDMGVDGVIYDRIEEFKTNKDNIFRLEYHAKRALLEQIARDVSNGIPKIASN